MIRRLLLFLALASPGFAVTPEATAIAADHQETSLRTGETILTGHPHVDYGDLRLTADEIRINPKTRVVVARGHAILTSGPRRLLADVITYHSADGTYETGDLRMGEYPIYLAGTSATGGPTGITIHHARVSVPEPGALIPTLQAARLFFSTDRKIHADRASLGIGPVRPFSLHGFEHDVHDPLVSYVSLTGGYRRSLGVYTELGLHVPVSDRLKLGGDLGLYSNRGVMFGPSGSYAGANGDGDFHGFFRSGFIHDYGTRYNDVLGQPVPPNRGFVEWEHQQQIGGRLAITGQLNYWRDSEVIRDFRPSDFFKVQQPDTFFDSVYTGANYFVSLFARFQPNSFEAVPQRLPELRFDLLPLALPGGFYERFNASVVALRDRPPTGGPTLRSDRLDAYYGLSRPLRPADWLTFTPVAGGRFTEYADLSGARRNATRLLGEAGFDAALRTSGVYDYKNPRWKIDGLRHLFTPKLSYRYIPEAGRGAADLPAIDAFRYSTFRSPAQGGFSPSLPPLGLGDARNIDDLHGTNTLRLGFDNTLQTRDPGYGSRDLVRFDVANDFRFHPAPGTRDVSELHAALAVMPARWLEVGVRQSFAPQDLTLKEFDTGVTLRDGDVWAVRFSSNFLRHELDDYYIEASQRFNEVYEGVLHLRYDARLHRFNEQSYGIRQNLGNVWRVEYLVTLYDGQRRESRFGFNIRVDAIRF